MTTRGWWNTWLALLTIAVAVGTGSDALADDSVDGAEVAEVSNAPAGAAVTAGAQAETQAGAKADMADVLIDSVDLGAAMGDAGPVSAISTRTEPAAELPRPAGKKMSEWAAKRRAADRDAADRTNRHRRWQAQLRRRLGKAPTSPVNIYNKWTREILPVDDADAVKDERRNLFFRCHFTEKPTDISPRLFAALVAAARHFDVLRVHIVSGYRADKYNLVLRKKGREVARNSHHTLGSAIDFRLPGVPVRKLHNWARRQRLGGVGFYPFSRFIHMDVGPIRYWEGR